MKNKTTVSDAEKVSAYMAQLEHPLRCEVEAVRHIIKEADSRISERIKWNAPSYYYKEDLVTFNLRTFKTVHLVFHNIAIVQIKSDLLLGDYKDRRMMYFANMDQVNEHRNELERIIKEYVALMDI